MRRRAFLQGSAVLAAGATLGPAFWRSAWSAPARPGPGPYGPLLAANADGIRLPAGFTSRVVARSGQVVPGTLHPWHTFPDGGACFAAEDGGWTYVSNSEVPLIGGVGAIRFDADGEVDAAYTVLSLTTANCSGGPTPWGTWLSCEEFELGHVWECEVDGPGQGQLRPALGTFSHEAVTVDPLRGQLYLTEDGDDGDEFYRFTPSNELPDLSEGTLEVVVRDQHGSVTWLEVDAAEPSALRRARSGAPVGTAFRGNEGVWYDDGHVYFTNKGDQRVWDLDVEAQHLSVLYDAGEHSDPVLRGVDNVMASRCGDLYVAEDGGNMELVVISAEREVAPFLRVEGQEESEITGPAFSTTGPPRLYFSSQRGGALGTGVTYEVSGPFRPFLDVLPGHRFLESIWFVAVAGIAEGYLDRTFRPSAPITRQAMAAFLHRVGGAPEGPFADPGFVDVGPPHPFRHEISWMAQAEVASGYGDRRFRPAAPVTRQAMASFLHRMAGSPSPSAAAPRFGDVSSSHAFGTAITWLAETGVTEGYEDGTFRPGAPVTRQAMAVFLQRYVALG
jgi:hypothetical protein